MARSRAAWSVLTGLQADVALLQEAPPPPPGLEGHTYHEPFAPARPWATTIWSRYPLTPLPASSSVVEAPWRAGPCAAVEVLLPSGGIVTVLCIHAVDDRHRYSQRKDPKGYATATLHHVLSDITGYLDDTARRGRGRGHRGNRLIVGGDLNISLGWDIRSGRSTARLAFDRILDFGLATVLEIRPDDRHSTCVRDRIPYRQIDYLFTDCARPAVGHIADTPEIRACSDHLPIIAAIK